MRPIYQHLNFPEQLQQNMGGQLIAEIAGSRYKVVFKLDCYYAEQCQVTLSVLAKDDGWKPLLVQTGTENAIVAGYYSLTPPARSSMLRDGGLKRDVEHEMRKLCALAADINR
jgi:hypothetical protein